MSPKRKVFINLIAVALLGVVMVAWVLFRLIGSGAVDKPFAVTADFAQSGGVFTDQEVTYRGVLVGSVGDMALNEDGVSIELLIDPEWEGRIPADLTARVRSKSAVGEQYVDLVPNRSTGSRLSAGDEIPRSRTRLPVDFQELLKSLDAVLADVPPGRTRRLVKNLASGLGGRGDEIATILRSLGTLSDAFASVAPQQQRLLANSTKAGTAFLRTKRNFAAAIKSADKVLAGIGDEPGELRELFRQNDRFARRAITLLDRRGGKIAEGIRALGDFTEFQLDNQVDLVQSLRYVPQFLHAVEDAAVPWRDPDGTKYYRIRTGLVVDNVPFTWPCKYERPEDYERFPHEREPRTDIEKGMECIEEEEPFPQVATVVDALKTWAAENPATVTTRFPVGEVGEPAGLGARFVWPHPGPLTSPFGPRWGRIHAGIDIDGETGDPVVAPDGGRVIATSMSGYGNTIILDHGNGVGTLYGHLSTLAVTEGQDVVQGELVGLMGSTGHSTGSHLHFEIRLDGSPVDPLPYLPGGSRFLLSLRSSLAFPAAP